MKKLMLAAAIVCAAVGAQAAQFVWTSRTPIYQMNDSENIGNGVTAYLFKSGDILTMFEAWQNGSTLAEIQADLANETTGDYTGEGWYNSTIQGGKIGTKSSDPIERNNLDVLTAVIVVEKTVNDEKYLFISEAVSKNATSIGAATMIFTADNVSSSKSAAHTGWYDGSAGWYGVVPEPTSGLLLLLGMAGLALKRKRA